jgi:hypothetical protein
MMQTSQAAALEGFLGISTWKDNRINFLADLQGKCLCEDRQHLSEFRYLYLYFGAKESAVGRRTS